MLLTHEEMSHMRSFTAPDTFYLKWLLIRVEGLSARRFHTAAMYVGIPKTRGKSRIVQKTRSPPCTLKIISQCDLRSKARVGALKP